MIAPRPSLPQIRRPAARQPVRRPPTRGQLSVAAYRLADELGGREIPQADRDNAASKIYTFAAGAVATAWSLVNAADIAVRCYSGRRKVSGANGDVVEAFRKALDKARGKDLARREEILKALPAAEDGAKAALEAELQELTLGGIPQGRSMRQGPAAIAFLTEGMIGEFQPVKGSPLAEQDLPALVKASLRFFDWLAWLVFTDETYAGYRAAQDADKAARADASAEPAPADEEEADEESAESDAEAPADEEQAPAAQSA